MERIARVWYLGEGGSKEMADQGKKSGNGQLEDELEEEALVFRFSRSQLPSPCCYSHLQLN